MSGFIQDFITLFFSGGEKVKAKAQEYKKEREKRFSEYEKKPDFGSSETKQNNTINDFLNRNKEIKNLLQSLGIFNKNEVDELKQKINELQKRINELEKSK